MLMFGAQVMVLGSFTCEPNGVEYAVFVWFFALMVEEARQVSARQGWSGRRCSVV